MTTITGTNGDDRIHGTNNDDVIFGGGGNDTIDGKKGNDEIYGGAGNDEIHGDQDNDTIYGEDGNDALYGDDGNDDLTGGAGFDFINGGDGFDTARYSGSIHEYSFTNFGGGMFVSHNGGAGADGTDFVIGVERLVFADAVIDLTANNAPIAQDDNVSMTEDDGSASGNVTDNDFDFENNTLTVTPGVFAGSYGTLTLNADGSYSYVLYASTQSLAEGASAQDSFSYTVSDGSLTDTGTLTFTIAGLNDAPVANADTATGHENEVLTVDVLANDDDVDDGAVLTVTAASAPAGQGTATIVGNQVEFDPGTDFDYLAAGESVDVVLNYTIEDEHGASSNSTVTVTVTGTNDAPTIDAGGTDASGSATELPDGDAGENVTVHTDSGTVAFDDVDLSDTHSASFTPQGGSYLGTFTLDPVDQSGDNVGWDFSVSDADLDSLAEGEVVTQTYTIEIDDGNGGTVTQDVTVTITGAADGPPAWYIDNSAVGSANTGTQADPFTSIAAFNAAQGTVGGPDVGHTVYLLAGTGSGVYAEADGINLLDGQTLTGVATGAVRPSIQPTAGNGVDLAENNTLSGFDIVTTTGTGILDTASTTGGVTISDVSVSTSSGAAIVLNTASNVSIANVTISSTGNYAILASNVDGFSLSDSVVTGAASADATIAFTDLTGIAALLGNTITGGGGDNLRVVNNAGTLDLEIADSVGNQAVIGLNDSATGEDGVHVESSGAASVTLTIDGVDFLGARSDLIHTAANGASSQDITLSNNVFANTHANTVSGGGGVFLTGGGPGSNISVDYVVENNSFTGAEGHALAALYTQASGSVRGYITGNVIGVNDGVGGSQGSSGGGSGIFVALDRAAGAAGSATYSVNIAGNEVYDIASGTAGIHLVSNGGGAASPSVLEATVTGNTVDELGDFAFVGFYAVVGGGAGSGDFARLGLDLSGNTFDASDADFGANAVLLDQISSDAHYYFPGYTGSGDGEFTFPGGTASADLDAFWSDDNVFVNGAFPSFPGGVDAGLIMNATGDPLTLPVFFG